MEARGDAMSDPQVPEPEPPITPNPAWPAVNQANMSPAAQPAPWSGPPATTYCYACGLLIDARAAICPRCGVVQPQSARKGHPNAVLGLVLNLFFPGVGSLVVGATPAGIVQLILFVLSFPLDLILIGFPLLLAVWIWALIVSIQAFSKPYPA